MKRTLTIFIGFVHDFAAGCWAATVLTVWWLERNLLAAPEAAAVLNTIQRQFCWVGVGCSIVLLATGAGRGFTYVDNVYGRDAESQRRRMLIVKHILLLGVVGTGTWWQFAMAY